MQLEAAGLARFSSTQFLVSTLAIGFLSALMVFGSFEIIGLSISVGLGIMGLCLETLASRAKSRNEELANFWPEVIESLQSAASSGITLIDSLAEIALSGPERVRLQFAGLVQRIDSGWDLDLGLDWLKKEFGESHADRLIELIRIVHVSGGQGYLVSLRNQAAQTRVDVALWGELTSKQGWVSGTAKMAIAAPWLIVAMLASRPENVGIYNSVEGVAVLGSGLIVSVLAYRLIHILGALDRPVRVFSS